jgi:CxxC motif-containing protein (DUF1111 family)
MNKKLHLLSAAIIFLAGCDLTDKDSDASSSNNEAAIIWQPNAGNATAEFDPDLPFLQFIPELDLSELSNASQGRELFIAEWAAAPGSRPLLDGLGPLSITSACSQCHLTSGRTPSLEDNGEVGLGLLFRLGDALGNQDPYYGGQLQTAATTGNSEGYVTWGFDESNKPVFTLTTNYVALTDGINLGPRLSPQLVGIGLLNLVSDEDILIREDENDSNNDGISGRAHWRTIDGQQVLGRFGWKAMQPSLEHQSAGALQQDMGLTTSLNPTEPCTSLQTICDEQPSGGSPEVSDNSLAAINDFLTLLAVPARRIDDQQEFDQGSQVFDEIGCAKCHQPTLTTSNSSTYPLLANQLIYPYTDLLLHDLGEDLNDQVKEGDAHPQEWRTPPLWSLGLVEATEGSRFLHDGRAATIEEAILWHGGEGLSAKNNFEALSNADKENILSFLRSI